MTVSPSTTSTTSKAPAKVKATTAKRPGTASMTGRETVNVSLPAVVRFKAKISKSEQTALESALESGSNASGTLAVTVTGIAVALTYALGASWAEANLTGSLRSWAITGAAMVRKCGITTHVDPAFKDVLILAERRGVDSINAMSAPKAKAALRAIGAAETVKAKQAAIKANVPTTSNAVKSGNAKAVKAEQVASRITRLHESLPSQVVGDESQVADLLTVLERLAKDVKRLASTAKAPAAK